MAEKTNVDGQVPEGDAGLPNSASSDGGSGAPVAGNVAELPELVKAAVEEALKPVKGDINGLYSRQDKDRKAFREFMDEYNKGKGKGLSDAEAYDAAENAITSREKQAEKDRMIEEIYTRFVGSPSAQPVGNGASGAVNADQVFAEMGLDRKDPLVNTVLAGLQGKDRDAIELAGYRLAKQIQSAPTPTPAQAASLQGGTPKTHLSTSEVEQKSAELISLYRNPTVNAAQIKEMEEELEPYLPK